MNCRQVMRLISAYVDGELTGVEMLEIRRHISDCAECRDEFEATRSAKLLVSRLRTVQPPADFMQNLAVRLDEIRVPAYVRIWHAVSGTVRERITPVGTAFVAVSIALAALSARSIGPVTPAVNSVAMAQTSTPEILRIKALDPGIRQMKTDPIYTLPVSMNKSSAPALDTFEFASWP